MTSTDRPPLAVRAPADLIAAVPYLIGFHPTDSVVVVATRGKRVIFAARGDLPVPGGDPGETAGYIIDMVRRHRADAAMVVGYGPPERATPAVDEVRAALVRAGLRVLDALRVTDGRYWSYLCSEPACCPPEGTAYDTTTSAVAAAAVFAGEVALPDRASLVAQVAPLDGPTRASMRQATMLAAERLADLLDGVPAADPGDDRAPGEPALRTAGESAVRAAVERYAARGRLTDDEVAALSLYLAHLPVRDYAWERTDGTDEHLALWTDVLRRAEPELVPAPACLLAFAAWRAGRGALAVAALERALAARPDYSMALLLDEVLRYGVPPSELDGWPAIGGDERCGC